MGNEPGPGATPRAKRPGTVIRGTGGARLTPGPPEGTRSWYVAAGIAAVVAVAMLSLHTNFAIIAAGLLAAGVTGTALAVARLRWRRPDAANVASVITAALILATVLSVLLGLVMASRPGR